MFIAFTFLEHYKFFVLWAKMILLLMNRVNTLYFWSHSKSIKDNFLVHENEKTK